MSHPKLTEIRGKLLLKVGHFTGEPFILSGELKMNGLQPVALSGESGYIGCQSRAFTGKFGDASSRLGQFGFQAGLAGTQGANGLLCGGKVSRELRCLRIRNLGRH